ncbi:MAG: rod shape-determining protein MreD [Ruminococcaceae bacterium]|nr:rod shape-determining protein MreD [Oscillospiraceae bacterium]
MRIVLKTLGIYFAFLLQSLFFENLKLFSCSPDILVAVVIIIAVSESFVAASVMGAFAGLLIDVMYGQVFGINILLYMYLALIVSIAADKKNLNSPLIMSWVCFVSIAAMEIVVSILKFGIGSNLTLGLIVSNIFVKGIFAALFALVFVLLTLKREKMRKTEIPAAETNSVSEEEVIE